MVSPPPTANHVKGVKMASMDRGTVLVLSPYYLPAYKGGGPIRSLGALAELHGRDWRLLVLTSAVDHGDTRPMAVDIGDGVRLGNALVHYVMPNLPSVYRALRGILRAEEPCVIYLNSLFHPLFSLLPLAMRRLGLLNGVVLLAPRGELGFGALAVKVRKKRWFLRLLARPLTRGIYWHATTNREASEIAAHFGDVPVVVRSNETSLPSHARRPSRPGGPADVLQLVFVSRVDRKKRLHYLLQALALVRTRVSLDVFGAFNSKDYEDEVRALAGLVVGQHQVTFHGPVSHADILSALQVSDLFVFPTAHENFGHVVPESLSQACPVAVGEVTPWTPWIQEGGGVLVTDTSPVGWAQVIEDFASLTPGEKFARRMSAADTYEAWRSTSESQSVFDLLFDDLAGSTQP